MTNTILPLFMRKIISLTVIGVFSLSCASPNHVEPIPDPSQPEPSSPSIGPIPIEQTFLDHLNEKATTYNDDSSFPLSNLKDERTLVWESWKKANAQFVEQKLNEMAPLSKTTASRWNLPENLEPHAILPYYYGCKGNLPESGYPLFIYTHGSGDKESEWSTGFDLCRSFNDSPSAYFIPQIPNTGNYYRWWQKSKQFAWEKLFRLAFLSGQVDPNKVYIFGISEGGYGSQRLASFYADYLAGAGPMAGGEPLINAPVENCRNIAFSLRTGANDSGFYRNKLTQYTKDEFTRLQTLYPQSFTHYIELIPGMGHFIDYSSTTPWLRSHTRYPYPKVVSWENFEMDGRYRNGFYNLSINERSNPNTDSRTSYELTINGNNITLKVNQVTYQCIEKDPIWGIGLKYQKEYQPATTGKITVYLCEQLVDLTKEITLTANGKEVFKGIPKLTRKNIIQSCMAFFDPMRLYPAAIEVDLSKD